MKALRVIRVATGAIAFVVLANIVPGLAIAADDFNPPWWVDTDNNGRRDNRDAHFLEPGESLVIGVNPDWDPPANSSSYHWHWYSTIPSFASQGYYEEYDAFQSDTWFLPDHQQNLWNQLSGPWVEAAPTPMPRNWGDFDLSALLADPRWGEAGYFGDDIPDGAPRGRMNNGIPGLIWSPDGSGEPFTGVFEVPLYADLDLPTTLVRLQYGGGFPSDEYWITAVEGFDDGQLVPVARTFRSEIDGTIYYEDWQFDGSPDWMRLSIEFSGSVDQVLIDTIAVPEPSAVGLLGSSVLAWGMRRRNRSQL